MKSELVWPLAAAGLAGILLSLIYFGGLWFTIQQAERVRRPLLLFGFSFILRLSLVLAGFYLVSAGRLERLAICLVTFLLTRQILLMRAQPPTERKAKSDGN